MFCLLVGITALISSFICANIWFWFDNSAAGYIAILFFLIAHFFNKKLTNQNIDKLENL